MPADEILSGAAAIAKALGLTRRRVYHHAAAGRLPVFRMGATLCAKRSSLESWLASCDDPAASSAPTGGAHAAA